MKKLSPVMIILFVLLGVGALWVGYRLLGEGAGLEPLPAAAYREHPAQFLGNHYRLDAQMEGQLAWREGVGKVITVSPLYDADLSLPVFLPEGLEENLHVGQRYRMRVRVGEGGLLQVSVLKKF